MKVLWLKKPQSEPPLHFGGWTDPKIVVGPGKDVPWLVFWDVWIQVKELYQQKKNKANLPDYIQDISNPNRAEHFDSIIKLRSKVFLIFPFSLQICLNIKHNIRIGFGNVKPIKDIYLVLYLEKKNICNIILFFEDKSDTYDAWRKDLAMINIFFGQETIMGEQKHKYKH